MCFIDYKINALYLQLFYLTKVKIISTKADYYEHKISSGEH